MLHLDFQLRNFLANKILFSKIRFYFIYIFMSCLLIRQVGVFVLVPAFLDSLIFSVLGIFGFLLVIWGILGKNINFNFKKNYLLFFISAVFISSIINFKYGIFKNLKDIIWLFITFFVIYSFPKNESEESKIKKFYKIQNLIIYIWGILAFCSIITALIQISYISHVRDEWWLRIGIVENRLFGIFNNTNSASIISFVSLVFSVYQIKFKNIFFAKKNINLLNIVIQFMYIALSESRGTYMILMFASFLVSLFLTYNKLEARINKNKKLKNIFFSFILSIIFALFILILIFLIIKLFAFLSNLYSIIFNNNTKNLIVSKRVDFVNNRDVSNLRFRLWLDSWEIFKNNWLFGVTAGNLISYAQVNFPDSLIATRNYSRVHNTWIGFLLFNGIFGSLFLFTFFIKKIICIFKYYLNYYLKYNILKVNKTINLCVLIVLCTCLYGTVESEILFVNSTVSTIFWLALGLINIKLRSAKTVC